MLVSNYLPEGKSLNANLSLYTFVFRHVSSPCIFYLWSWRRTRTRRAKYETSKNERWIKDAFKLTFHGKTKLRMLWSTFSSHSKYCFWKEITANFVFIHFFPWYKRILCLSSFFLCKVRQWILKSVVPFLPGSLSPPQLSTTDLEEKLEEVFVDIKVAERWM